MYQLIRTISIFVRQIYIPNPFESESTGYIYATILNILIEPFVQAITYAVVGIFYEKRSNPALGSFLYLLFYSLHVGLIMLIGYFDWSKVAIVVTVVVYIVGLLFINGLVKKIKNLRNLGE